MVFAMAMCITCGGGNAQTGDLGTDTEGCTRKHRGGGDGESRRTKSVVFDDCEKIRLAVQQLGTPQQVDYEFFLFVLDARSHVD